MALHRTRSGSLLKLGAALSGLSVLIGVTLLTPADDAQARPPVDDAAAAPGGNGPKGDSLPNPLAEKQAELKSKALERTLKGKATAVGKNKVVEVAKGQYVELANEGSDKIFVVLAEFGLKRHTAYPDCAGPTCAVEPNGPLHNAIWEPDRDIDNSTLWQADFDQAHYENMYFTRMADYYESQSSGRYTVEGAVTEWVKVPYNEARYGRDACGGIVCSNTWQLVRHAINIWVADQLAAGMTINGVIDYLKTFDEWDRYDHDGDSDFDEPDGYIDHFQIVHAGGDQAASDPQQLGDAIWSHRWYVNTPGIGVIGPTVGGELVPFGGYEIGGAIPSSPVIGEANVTFPTNATGIWVGDYTIQPENGGLGVFAHEYGHDLGLPDLYDTSGNTGGAENSTGFWTLMSSGANIGDGGANGIGDAPTDMGVWEKFQLGWLNYDVAFAGLTSTHRLGPAEKNTKAAQALFVVLPDKKVVANIGAPYAGTQFYYSGAGDGLDTTMTKAFTLPAGASLSAKVRYDIELDWDYAYLRVSSDNGASWTNVATNLSTNTNPNGQNFGNGITGDSDGWVDLTASLAAFTGPVQIQFRYWTDGAVVEPGISIDEIQVTGQATDGAESDTGWTFNGGFRRSTGQEEAFFFNAYVAENRSYRWYDASLATAYNFGFLNTMPDWVEHYPYQDGLLISYWDTSFPDNSVGDHPGGGLLLPVDAHPTFHHSYDGHLIRPRHLTFDSTFTLAPTDAITLHKDGQPTNIPSQPAVSLFNDMNDYWFNCDAHACTGAHVGRYQPGWVGVKVPKTGTTIKLEAINATGFMQVVVNVKR